MARVVLNRVERGYASSICKVVYQKGQFSWTNNYAQITETKAYYKAKQVALWASYDAGGFNATHFHNKSLGNPWKMKYITTIDAHVFYQKI